MAWQLNPYALPLFISAIPLFWVTRNAWHRRSNVAVRVFFVFMLLSLGLVLSYAMELLSATLPMIKFWLVVEYICHLTLVAWFFFTLTYAGYDRILHWRYFFLIMLIPAFILPMVITNDLHGLIWATTGTQIVDGKVFFDRSYGPFFWVWVAYLNTLVFAGGTALLWRIFRSPRLYRGQVGLLILGVAIPWLACVLTILRVSPVVDLVPFGVAFGCIPIALSLLRFRLLDMLPAAHLQIVRSIQDIVIVCGEHGGIIEVNPAAEQFAGAPAREIIGKALDTRFPMLGQVTRQALLHNEAQEIECESGSTTRVYDVRVSALKDISSTVRGWVIVMRDVSNRREIEQQVIRLALERERVHALQEIIENVSHDFKTPVSVMFSSIYLIERYIQKLRENGSLDEEALRHIQRLEDRAGAITDSSQQLARTVDMMLETIRLELKAPSVFSTLDLNALASVQVARHQTAYDHLQLQLQLQLDENTPYVRGSASELHKALAALVDNASQYTPAGGTVTVRTCYDGEHGVIEVSDTGMGIEAVDLPHIFERFYRGDRARSVATGEGGLGLAVARQIVERHGGQISVSSTPQEGSTFRIILKAAQPEGIENRAQVDAASTVRPA